MLATQKHTDADLGALAPVDGNESAKVEDLRRERVESARPG